MDRSRVSRSRNQTFTDYNSSSEPEYDVVDEQVEGYNVHIFPSRPINDNREYADRDPPRSYSSPRLSSLSTLHQGSSNIVPREIPRTPGPSINRDLKPGRRLARIDKRPAPAPPGEQHSHSFSRSSPSSAQFLLELSNHLPRLRDGQTTIRKKAPHTTALQSLESVSATQNILRYSLDLESHDLEKRSHQSLERVSSKRHHHEWPQTKEDIDQHDFVPMEKPPQTHWEEDWYVGACNRADAEHALHLVNKDGAFLVRDCSICSDSEPLVLTVYHDKKVYNVKIRFMESISKYALGTSQRSNDMFDSVADIIKFHTIFPIILISGRNVPGSRYPENCVLTCPVTKMDVYQLLQ